MSPLYVFRCMGCNQDADLYFATTDVSEYECPYCGCKDGKKVPQPSSFRLKNKQCGGFTNTKGEVVGCDKAPGPNIDKK